MTAIGMLALASATLVGTHFLLSHPLRAPLVARLGEKGFTGLYSLVALVTFVWMIRAYGPASAEAPQPLWESGEAEWLAATLVMWLGSILFLGSLRRNPALPRPGRPIEKIDDPRGVYAITRHPMMWGFALWAAVHATVNPTKASLVLSSAIAILALGGAVMQDAKKARLLGEVWRDWQMRTNFLPFGKGFAMPDTFAFVAGTIVWLAATWAHGALGYRSAGIWDFFA
ncbi:NnrU family protein [Sphingomonas sp. G124]|uniref:NnrU family protein n=1 Tax=Sphingomonas cremea TaxID=2904799 RepID=A0A9X1U4N4_9SPHN|nr:NnrU family protein [Sphingomonas cremea]MCF2514361.1 NnrU family protein [Sphingomonas cremea]